MQIKKDFSTDILNNRDYMISYSNQIDKEIVRDLKAQSLDYWIALTNYLKIYLKRKSFYGRLFIL